MLKFSRECLAEGNWQTNIPYILIDAHKRLRSYEQDPTALHQYYQQPQVWADIQSVFEAALHRNPAR